MVNWVIESNVFPENQQKLINEIDWQQHRYFLVDRDEWSHVCSLTGPTIFYGSLALSQRLRKKTNWVGNWSDLSKFRCSSYYSKYGDALLNENYCLIPIGDFERMRARSNATRQKDYFIRPDSAFKTFTGDIIRENRSLKNFLVNSVLFDDELILVTKPKRIHREWRFIICGGEIAGYSLYMRDGQQETSQECPQHIQDFVKTQLYYEPEPCYTLDVCEDENLEPKIVEINCFSCSGFYEADLGKIVEAASRVALKEWEELYE